MQWLASLVARARRMDPVRFDVAVGLFVALEGQVELTVFEADGSVLLGRLIVIGIGVGLMFRRRAPLASLIAVFTCYMGVRLAGAAVSENLVLPLFALFLSVYSLGRHSGGRKLVAGTVFALVVSIASLIIDEYEDSVGSLLFAAFTLVLAPMVIGQAVAQRARLSEALRTRAAQLERERTDRAEAAVVAERTRIAGELHDVVAHALGAMTVQASAAGRLATRDPERAAEAFAAVEATGRDALTEMRALLGVLRRDDEGIALDPQPSLTHLSTLVRRAAAAGLPVRLGIEGERQAVPAGVDLVAYRVVQEALTGAIEGGSAAEAEVTVRYRDGAIELDVADDGDDTRALPGVRERVALYGGELRAGRRRDGGNAVRARLPLGEAVA